ncbi:MAG: sugar phosphate isomerase/epimerase family protein [Acidobacteriaceae bacterium]
MSLEDFLYRAKELDVDGVSLESCFFPGLDWNYLADIKGILDALKLDRVYAWGHPNGLEGGTNQPAYDDMLASIERAKAIGADVIRVVGSSLMFRHQPHEPQLERLTRMFSEAIKIAERYGIRLAVENHIDFTAEEMLRLVTGVNSSYLGVNFDTGNFVRLLDDPIKGMEKLAKYVYATHIKDLKPQKGVAADEWYFFSSTPVGDGIVDNLQLARLLADVGYRGFLAVEIDFLHPDYQGGEDEAVAKSIRELKKIAAALDGMATKSLTPSRSKDTE